MSRSRHFRRILAASVVASVSLTWGAGVAFAHESPPPINQSNGIGVEQTGCGVDPVLTSEEYPAA